MTFSFNSLAFFQTNSSGWFNYNCERCNYWGNHIHQIISYLMLVYQSQLHLIQNVKRFPPERNVKRPSKITWSSNNISSFTISKKLAKWHDRQDCTYLICVRFKYDFRPCKKKKFEKHPSKKKIVWKRSLTHQNFEVAWFLPRGSCWLSNFCHVACHVILNF